MKKLSVLAVVVLAVAFSVAQAELVMVEDFESYTAGESIHLKGTDDLGWGDPVARWYVQRNSSILGDHGWTTVEAVDGDNCLQMTNRDVGGEIDTVYTAMSISEFAITGQGTIYLRFKATGPNDTLCTTNDLAPGYDYDGTNTTAGGDGFQGTTNYAEQMSMCRLSGGEDFRARNGGAYENVAMGQQANVWQELWIQYDNVMSQAQYFVCPEGGTPVQVMNTSGAWWGDRYTAGDGVYNIKFFVGMYPWPDANVETTVWVDTIAIDTDGFTTESMDDPGNGGPTLPGDANLDGTVDLNDFVILKTNFGAGTTWGEGDFDGDGDVDLDDFVILKTNFGTSL